MIDPALLQRVRERAPLVHCITNYVTVNDCANILLACGGSPIMADDEAEAAEITALAASLVINIGTLNSRTVKAMLLRAGRRVDWGIRWCWTLWAPARRGCAPKPPKRFWSRFPSL